MPDLGAIFDRISTAIWIYDFDRHRVHWANSAALELWDSPSLDALRDRDLGADMSSTVATKLEQYKEDFATHGSTFYEIWTLYPKGKPKRFRVECSGIRLEDGAMAMLSEAKDLETAEPDTVRGTEALIHTSVMITLLDLNGRQLYCNPAARAKFGGVGTMAEHRFVDRKEWRDFLASLDAERAASVVTRVLCADGEFWHRIHGVRCHDAVTGADAILLSESDVTEAQRAKFALEASRNDALRHNRQKSDFLANMSHEIRTPINGVVGMAQILDAMVTEPQQKQIIGKMLDSSDTLLNIINDVLDLSKIEAGKLDLEAVEFLPSILTDRIESLHNFKALEKRIAYNVESGADADIPRKGDLHRINQILDNIVGNAMKFTDIGAVTVRMASPKNGPLTIEVTDTGIGMTETQIARIFDEFEQADTSTTRRFGGTGLGMAIVRRLVDAMSGTIDVSSTPGMGTTFKVSLPLPCVEATDAQAEKLETLSAEAVAGLRVLAADDNSTNRFVIGGLLQIHGVEATIVGSGSEALAMAAQESFDVLLLDIFMPDMDGVKTLEAIREMERERGVAPTPAIAVTANAFRHQIAAYIEAGFDDHVAKPLRIEALIASLTRVLGAHEASAQKRAAGGS